MSRKIRMGMIGGGIGSFIGQVHRMAAALDGEIELVCGAFSSDPQRSKESGQKLFISTDRIYDTYEEMIQQEAKLPADVRMDMVSIVTPNHMHFGPAKLALQSGFHVVCDKPLCISLEEAKELERIVAETGLLFALTHNYTGYPMVKQGRAMIKAGELGIIRRVVIEYPQGWLSTNLEEENQKQAKWRTDPSKSGIAGAMGDIGTHAENLCEYMTGLGISKVCADLHTHIAGRLLDDDGSVLLRFDNGARGLLYASQISAGEENALRIRIYGEVGGMEWNQMEPNSLVVKWLDKPMQTYRVGVGNLSPAAAAAARVPAGHPEGYIEAFANIYLNVARCLQAREKGEEPDEIHKDFPSVQDGVRGMEFIYAVVKASKEDQKWIELN